MKITPHYIFCEYCEYRQLTFVHKFRCKKCHRWNIVRVESEVEDGECK